ncbi:hypothetical protein B0H14DRAFT_2883368 [Mycena olivaceomarginata]|nr:hypothetical protein B0H14DRAFT_2883368 [Mycena olivaceomarginata]
MPIHSIAPFPDAPRIVMCSNGIVDIWDTDHSTPSLAPDGTRRAMCSKGIWNTEENHQILAASIQRAMDLSGVIGIRTPYELRSPRNAELTCTRSEAGDTVYVAATAIDSRLLWDGNGELLDSNGPQWKYVRAKQPPKYVCRRIGHFSIRATARDWKLLRLDYYPRRVSHGSLSASTTAAWRHLFVSLFMSRIFCMGLRSSALQAGGRRKRLRIRAPQYVVRMLLL